MDRALKQRLVGASVLIALAVIVLPMLLGGRSEGVSGESSKIEIPAKPSELELKAVASRSVMPIAARPGPMRRPMSVSPCRNACPNHCPSPRRNPVPVHLPKTTR